MMLPLAGTIFAGGVGYHEIDVRIAETSQQVRRHIAYQDELDLMKKREMYREILKKDPGNEEAKKELEITERLLQKNMMIQQELEKERR